MRCPHESGGTPFEFRVPCAAPELLELFGSLAIGQYFGGTPDQQPTIVVVLAAPRTMRYQQGILVSCSITAKRDDYLEITCSD
jgi:hypothetical protein